jgi:hypothetical protein
MFRRYPNKDRVKRVQQLRRSNAATPIPDKTKWSRRMRRLWRKEIENDN